MARPKEFDKEKALDQAMALFWRKGYEATSVQELLEAMNIGRGSMYDTFGNKHQLFLATLQKYQANGHSGLVAPLHQSGSATEAIRQLFINLASMSTNDSSKKGCLVVNSAVELAPHDTATAVAVNMVQDHNEELFYQTILRGQQAGEISAEKKPRALARFLLNNVRGIRVMAKYNPDPKALQDIIDTTLLILE